MLVYGSDLKNKSVLSLHTSSPIAQLDKPIIDPYNLKIIAFKLTGPRLDDPENSYLLIDSIREISPIGFIVNSSDEIVYSDSVIKLKEIIDLGFDLSGIKVVSKKGAKIGKVSDFIADISQMAINQLVVERPFIKAFLDPELVIHRSKVVEITNEQIVIKDEKERPKSKAKQGQEKIDPIGDFVNPFRKAKPELESRNQSET